MKVWLLIKPSSWGSLKNHLLQNSAEFRIIKTLKVKMNPIFYPTSFIALAYPKYYLSTKVKDHASVATSRWIIKKHKIKGIYTSSEI